MKELILKSLQIVKGYLDSSPVADTRPRYKVISLSCGYLYYKQLYFSNEFNDWSNGIARYVLTGNSFNNGKFKEVFIYSFNNHIIGKGYIAYSE